MSANGSTAKSPPSTSRENVISVQTSKELGYVVLSQFSYTWTIGNFSSCQQRTGEALKSPTFSPANDPELKWRLHFYPNGVTAFCEDCVSFFLHFAPSRETQIRAQFECAIVTDAGESCSFSTGCGLVTFGTNLMSYGCNKYIKKAFLADPTNKLLRNDTLTIICRITVGPAKITNVFAKISKSLVEIPEARVLYEMEKLQGTKNCGDDLITLIVNGRELCAHKGILAARSPILAACLETKMRREIDQNVVEITDMDYEVVSQILRFVYTGKVSNNRQNTSGLLEAAEKYNLGELKVKCEEALCTSIKIGNAAEILVLADRLKLGKLKTAALEFIQMNTFDVMDTEGYLSMRNSQPHLIDNILREFAKNGRNKKRKVKDETIENAQQH